MRNRLVVANWKMNGSLEANARWAEAFLALEDAGCDAAVCAPSVYLSQINAGEIGIAFAAAVIYMVPGLLMFLHGEAYLVEGITYAGSVKG